MIQDNLRSLILGTLYNVAKRIIGDEIEVIDDPVKHFFGSKLKILISILIFSLAGVILGLIKRPDSWGFILIGGPVLVNIISFSLFIFILSLSKASFDDVDI